MAFHYDFASLAEVLAYVPSADVEERRAASDAIDRFAADLRTTLEQAGQALAHASLIFVGEPVEATADEVAAEVRMLRESLTSATREGATLH
jgi:hypothetical protein